LGVEQLGAVQHLMSLDPDQKMSSNFTKLLARKTQDASMILPGHSPEVTPPPLQQPAPMLTQTPEVPPALHVAE
jgi:hypothetical protein